MTFPMLDFILLRITLLVLGVLISLVLWRLQAFLAEPVYMFRLRRCVRAVGFRFDDNPLKVECFVCSLFNIDRDNNDGNIRLQVLRAEILDSLGDGK